MRAIGAEAALDGDNGALPEQAVSLSDFTNPTTADLSSDEKIPERAINLVAPVMTLRSVHDVPRLVGHRRRAHRCRGGAQPPRKGAGGLRLVVGVVGGFGRCRNVSMVPVPEGSRNIYTFPQMAELVVVGFRELIGVATILALALAIGAVCRELGTGPWVAATVSPWINAVTAAPLVFIAAGFHRLLDGDVLGHMGDHVPDRHPGGRDTRRIGSR